MLNFLVGIAIIYYKKVHLLQGKKYRSASGRYFVNYIRKRSKRKVDEKYYKKPD